MSFSKILTVLGLIAIGVMSRLLPHPPNCTSICSIALISAFQFKNCSLSFAIVAATLFLSDLGLGFHPMMPFVYFSFGLIILMGVRLQKMTATTIPLTSLTTSLIFFFVTNFGEWFAGHLYPKTIQGLSFCFFAAIPFIGNQILGDLCYSFLLFGIFQTFNSRRVNSKTQMKLKELNYRIH